jgi:multiple antibiotic resistance protein
VTELLSFSVVALSAIFFVVDPPGVVPLFIAMTAGDAEDKRRHMARRASLVAFSLLAGFALFGGVLFKVFGITLGAFKVAGGLLLLVTSLDMLRARPSRTRSSPDEQREGMAKDDVAIVPLATPLLAGPGAIATVMVLVARGKDWTYTVPVILSAAVTCLSAYLLLRVATSIDRVLGKSGLAIVERVMGLLLAAIAVQFMADGAKELLPSLGQGPA